MYVLQLNKKHKVCLMNFCIPLILSHACDILYISIYIYIYTYIWYIYMIYIYDIYIWYIKYIWYIYITDKIWAICRPSEYTKKIYSAQDALSYLSNVCQGLIQAVFDIGTPILGTLIWVSPNLILIKNKSNQ